MGHRVNLGAFGVPESLCPVGNPARSKLASGPSDTLEKTDSLMCLSEVNSDYITPDFLCLTSV